LLQHFVAEGIGEHGDGSALADAAGTDVEECLFVQLAYGASVGAFYVVVVYFKERLSGDVGLVGEEYILVGLIGLGFDCPVLHKHMAVESATGVVVEDSLEEFATVAVGESVVYKYIVVHLLLLVVEIETVGFDIAVLS
jgi:hypothetical protein